MLVPVAQQEKQATPKSLNYLNVFYFKSLQRLLFIVLHKLIFMNYYIYFLYSNILSFSLFHQARVLKFRHTLKVNKKWNI